MLNEVIIFFLYMFLYMFCPISLAAPEEKLLLTNFLYGSIGWPSSTTLRCFLHFV